MLDVLQTTWYPIATVKEKNNVLLLWGNADPVRVASGWYEEDTYAKRPKPFWHSTLRIMGIQWHRDNAPTHWAAIPDPT